VSQFELNRIPVCPRWERRRMIVAEPDAVRLTFFHLAFKGEL
jgi:hypothetical protein